MKRNSTFVCKAVCTVVILSLQFLLVKSQPQSQNNCTAPAMTFSNPTLIAGNAGQEGAKYKFPNVTPGVYAVFEVKDIVGGAKLTSIDDLTYGYSAAWQPVVKTPTMQGASESWVEFEIRFYNNSDNNSHRYDCAQLSFIDVDGDGQNVREFVAVKDYDSYVVSPNTILTISQTSGMLKAMGTVGNFGGLDTASYVTNINYRFTNCDKIGRVWIGNKTNSNFTVQDRYTCGYFRQISMPLSTPVLPVKYISFDGAVAGNSVILDWTTSEEYNNSHFEVERSFDASSFKTLGLVLDALVVNADKKSYKFKDNSAELTGKSVAYYRLKQVDRDGKFAYSTVIAVRLTGHQADLVKVTTSPNPFTDKLNVRFDAANSGVADLKIVNIAGQKIMTRQATITKGINTLQIDGIANLNPGVYIIQLSMNGAVIANQKIVKN